MDNQQGPTVQALYNQYFVITCKGKAAEKESIREKIYIHIYTYIYLNHCDGHLKLTQHCKSTIL